MESTGLHERFSRQTILPGVGVEGQQKWESSSVVLAGEGPALDAAKTALERAGLSRISLITSNRPETPPSFTAALILTDDAEWRRRLNRQTRLMSAPSVFGWGREGGFGLFLRGTHAGTCPCLECFEVMNPKAFSKSIPQNPEEGVGASLIQRAMGAMAATEILQWILKGQSPLEGKVWMTSFEDGVSFQHEVNASLKCPAALASEGAVATP